MSRIKIASLWTTTRRDGTQFLAGKFGYDGKIRIEENFEKSNERDPDYIAYVEFAEPKKPAQSAFQGQRLGTAPVVPPQSRGALPAHDYAIEGEVIE